jgi:hypothetical protein
MLCMPAMCMADVHPAIPGTPTLPEDTAGQYADVNGHASGIPPGAFILTAAPCFSSAEVFLIPITLPF